MDKMTLPCTLSGEVVPGNRIGRQLGFPTANLVLTDPAVDGGVYAVRVRVDGAKYRGVGNAGTRPTVTDRDERFLEVWLFDFDGDLYGKILDVELVAFLRPEKKFASLEALRRQIEHDRQKAALTLDSL
jgi:riboflavin kinase/FMN adenylyltransferase